MKKLFKKIYKGTKEKYEKHLESNLVNNVRTFVVTANPEAFMIAENDNEYKEMLLDEQTEIVADGIGLVKAANMLNCNLKERIPGIELAEKLLDYSNKYKKKVYLFGSKQNVIDDMKSKISSEYKGIKLVGTKNGYEKDKDAVFEEIAKLKPDVVLVALGMPLQEKLIYKHLDKFKKGIFIGVGGSFDVMSGNKKRAPKIFIKLNLEWLYRICSEPSRIKRFWDNNVKFLFKVRKLKKNHIRAYDLLFLIFLSSIIFFGITKALFIQKDINSYENRTAYKFQLPTIKTALSGDFQNSIELALSDQLPLSTTMKKVYTFSNNSITLFSAKMLLNDYCKNDYITILKGITTFGCNDNLIYRPSNLSMIKEDLDSRISNINNLIEKSLVPINVYYIEKDTDVNFSTNEHMNISD